MMPRDTSDSRTAERLIVMMMIAPNSRARKGGKEIVGKEWVQLIEGDTLNLSVPYCRDIRA